MPANIIKINEVIEFYVGDSKMPELMELLCKKGYPQNKEAQKFVKANNVMKGKEVK